MLPAEALRQIFSRAGVDESTPVAMSCGSGVTACIVGLALHVAFPARPIAPVYDGAWTEWASRFNPIDVD